jgi:E3 ubiquitin-protein ligase RNF115/126
MSDSASSTEIRAQRFSIIISEIVDTLFAPENRARFVLLDPVAISYIVLDFPRNQHEARDIEALLGVTSEKRGPLPASRVSIEAMPRVTVTKEESVAKECAICLDGYEVGGEAREMPCKHRFHSGCIERWLGLHGSCPVCRFAMPVEEGNVNSGGGEEGDRRALLLPIWITGVGDPITGRGSAAADSDESRGSDEVDDASTQDMQF